MMRILLRRVVRRKRTEPWCRHAAGGRAGGQEWKGGGVGASMIISRFMPAAACFSHFPRPRAHHSLNSTRPRARTHHLRNPGYPQIKLDIKNNTKNMTEKLRAGGKREARMAERHRGGPQQAANAAHVDSTGRLQAPGRPKKAKKCPEKVQKKSRKSPEKVQKKSRKSPEKVPSLAGLLVRCRGIVWATETQGTMDMDNRMRGTEKCGGSAAP
jgi:hypothetical protein